MIDKALQQEKTRERVKRYRDKQKALQEGSVTGESVTEMVSASYVQGLEGRLYEFLPIRPRYLTLSDGQVLDRAYRPDRVLPSGIVIQALRASNECLNYRPNTGDPKELKAKYDVRNKTLDYKVEVV